MKHFICKRTISLAVLLVALLLVPSLFSSSAFSQETLNTKSVSTAQSPSGVNPRDEMQEQFSDYPTKSRPGFSAKRSGNHFNELENLVGLLKKIDQEIETLSSRVSQITDDSLVLPSKPSAERGKPIFREMACFVCHGLNGKGHEAKTNMKDERGLRIMAADLTQPGSFGNGNTRKDIFRTIMTGLDGSPMPSFVDLFIDDKDRARDLVEYVYSLQEDALSRDVP